MMTYDVSQGGSHTLTGRCYPTGQPMTVTISNGQIVSCTPSTLTPHRNGTERWISPGFFDIQVNGFAGRNFTDAEINREDVAVAARALLATGTTRFLPTIVTADMQIMCRQLATISDAIENDPLVAAMCPGAHVEGPFIRPEDGPRGAHPSQHVLPPSIDMYDRLASAAKGRIAILTLAPEIPGALELIRHARQQGVVVALGHHRADEASLEAAIEAGAAICTHLGNGTDALLPRHDNYVWSQLGEDRLWASFIADGHHLPPATLRCMLRAKTVSRSILVTDAIGAAGMPVGRYRLGPTQVELLEDGRVILPGTPFLAGSAADMPQCLRCAIYFAGVSITEAITMVSVQPSRLFEPGSETVTIQKGMPANLVELDFRPTNGDIRIRQTVMGQWSTKST